MKVLIMTIAAFCVVVSAYGSSYVLDLDLDGTDTEIASVGSYWDDCRFVTASSETQFNEGGYLETYNMDAYYYLTEVWLTDPIDVTNAVKISFDGRYYQDKNNSDRYADAPIGFQIISEDAEGLLYRKKYEWPFGPNVSNPNFSTMFDWLECDFSYADDQGAWFWSPGEWTPTNVIGVAFYGTDWYCAVNPDGTSANYDVVDVKNLLIEVPEPGTLAMLGFGLMSLLGLSRRKK